MVQSGGEPSCASANGYRFLPRLSAHSSGGTALSHFNAKNEAVLDKGSLEALAVRYAQAWCSQNAASVAAFFTEHGSLTINNAPPAIGRHAIANVAQEFMTAFPDMIVTMDEVEFGDFESVFRWILTGTNSGPGGSGKRVQISGYEEWRFGAGNLILQSKGHFDPSEYERQLQQGTDD